MDQLIIVKH